MRKFARIIAGISMLVLLGTAGSVLGATSSDKQAAVIDKVKNGKIDWTNMMIYATGQGAMPPASVEPNRAKAYLKAKGYAQMQAIANLLMAVEGTAISYEGYGKDYMAQDETLRQKIEGYLRNVEVIDEKREKIEDDSIVMVTVGTRLFGQHSLGSAFLDELSDDDDKSAPVKVDTHKKTSKKRPEKIEPAKSETPAIAAPADSATEPAVTGEYTSLIIDCRGYDVARAMSPKIRRTDGSEVWGTLHVDPEFVNETGIVGYAKNMEMAKNCSRCGKNPLVVKATGRAGGAAMCDVVISETDATRVLAENNRNKFMDQFKVIFLVDPAN